MKKLIILFALLLLNVAPQIYAQEVVAMQEIDTLEQQKEEIIADEKEALKKEVERIILQLENKEISLEEAETLKMEAAKNHALNIENRIAILENEVALRERNYETNYIALGGNGKLVDINLNNKKEYENRTSSDIVIAFGLNNALQEGQSLNDSDFKIAGSRFFEIGWAWKTRVFNNSNWLRFKYGISFQFNGLKPTDNRYFVENEEEISLEEFPIALDKSKFRMDNLVIPIHFEFGPSKKVETDRYLRYYTQDKLKIGLGAYAGINISTRQKLKYEQDGENVKEKLKNDYNTNDVIYGLSGYIGLSGIALYVKYDLNPIFEDSNTELHNVSVGLRFDVD